jgi:hypothetical protein
MRVLAYIHSLKDKEHDRHVLGEATIIKSISNNLYIADYNGVKCTAILIHLQGAILLMMFMVCARIVNSE